MADCQHERLRHLDGRTGAHEWCRDCGSMRKVGGRWVPPGRPWRTSKKRSGKKISRQIMLWLGEEADAAKGKDACSSSSSSSSSSTGEVPDGLDCKSAASAALDLRIDTLNGAYACFGGT